MKAIVYNLDKAQLKIFLYNQGSHRVFKSGPAEETIE